jgi:hypothetical protein
MYRLSRVPSLTSTSTAAEGGNGATRLSLLPLELLEHVFAQLDNVDDYFAAGYALPDVWPVALRHALVMHAASTFGQWAGIPVIGVSSLDSATDFPEDMYPPGLLSAADMVELRAGIGPHGPYPCEYVEPGPASLYAVARWRYRCAAAGAGLASRGDAGFGALLEKLGLWGERMYRTQEGPQTYLPRLWSLLAADERYQQMKRGMESARQQQRQSGGGNLFYPAAKAWVLRNLTTRELVRPEVLARRPSDIRGPFVGGILGGADGICLGDVVVLRTRFARSRLSEHQGMWAGHRLDITTVERHRRERRAELELWTDVSEEVAREMIRLWENRLGRPYC